MFNYYRSRIVRAIGFSVMSLLMLASFTASAAVQTYYISGELRNTVSAPLVAGIPFTGFYTFDDAVADTNGSATFGSYATGEFFVDFGPAIGSITFDNAGSTATENNGSGFFGTTEDVFQIAAGEGARNTPGFSNTITGLPTLFFRENVSSPPDPLPDALTDDTLAGVPHLIGNPDPWPERIISWTMQAAGGNNPIGCGPFATNCFVTLDITSISAQPPASPSGIPTLNAWGLLIMVGLFGGLLSLFRRRYQ